VLHVGLSCSTLGVHQQQAYSTLAGVGLYIAEPIYDKCKLWVLCTISFHWNLRKKQNFYWIMKIVFYVIPNEPCFLIWRRKLLRRYYRNKNRPRMELKRPLIVVHWIARDASSPRRDSTEVIGLSDVRPHHQLFAETDELTRADCPARYRRGSARVIEYGRCSRILRFTLSHWSAATFHAGHSIPPSTV